MLFPLVKFSFIPSSIWPKVNPSSILFIKPVLALIVPAIWESERSLPVHLVRLPIAFILPAIRPLILSKSIHLVVLKKSNVLRSIWPVELSRLLLPIYEFPSEPRAVCVDFLSPSVRFVVVKNTSVDSAIVVVDFTFSLGSVLKELSFIPLAILVYQSSLPVLSVFFELSNI